MVGQPPSRRQENTPPNQQEHQKAMIAQLGAHIEEDIVAVVHNDAGVL